MLCVLTCEIAESESKVRIIDGIYLFVKVKGDENETCRTHVFVGVENGNFIFTWEWD